MKKPSYENTVIIDGELVPKDKNGVVVLSRYLKDKKLSAYEKIYLSLIDVWGDEVNDLFELYIPYDRQEKIKRGLKRKGYINNDMSPKELKEQTIKQSHTGQKCEWCGNECFLLHAHHYPIPKKDGGTNVVHICPNCHCTFHSLQSFGMIDTNKRVTQ